VSSGEALAAWAPALTVFLRRSAVVGVITLAVMALVGWAIGAATGYWQALYAGPVLALAYNIGFEDPARWRAARQNRWYLRSDALTHIGPEDETRIPLADIEDARKRLSWDVIVFLKGGMRVRMSYVRNPSDIAQQILAARDRMIP